MDAWTITGLDEKETLECECGGKIWNQRIVRNEGGRSFKLDNLKGRELSRYKR